MTMAEYELKFTQLSVYAVNLVATEEEKCLKFEEGLTYEIHSKLTLYDLKTFPRLIAAATRAEKLVNEKKVLLSCSEEVSERVRKRKEYQDPVPPFLSKRGNNESECKGLKKRLTESPPDINQDQKSVYPKRQRPRCSNCGKTILENGGG